MHGQAACAVPEELGTVGPWRSAHRYTRRRFRTARDKCIVMAATGVQSVHGPRVNLPWRWLCSWISHSPNVRPAVMPPLSRGPGSLPGGCPRGGIRLIFCWSKAHMQNTLAIGGPCRRPAASICGRCEGRSAWCCRRSSCSTIPSERTSPSTIPTWRSMRSAALRHWPPYTRTSSACLWATRLICPNLEITSAGGNGSA